MSTCSLLQSACLIYVKNAELSWPDKVFPCKYISTKTCKRYQLWSILGGIFHVWRVSKLNAILYIKMCFGSFRASFSTGKFSKTEGVYSIPSSPSNSPPPFLYNLPFPVAITSPTVTLMINTGSCTAPSLASRSYCGVMPLLVLISCRKLMGVLPGGISAI